MLSKKAIAAFAAGATLLSGLAFAAPAFAAATAAPKAAATAAPKADEKKALEEKLAAAKAEVAKKKAAVDAAKVELNAAKAKFIAETAEARQNGVKLDEVHNEIHGYDVKIGIVVGNSPKTESEKTAYNKWFNVATEYANAGIGLGKANDLLANANDTVALYESQLKQLPAEQPAPTPAPKPAPAPAPAPKPAPAPAPAPKPEVKKVEHKLDLVDLLGGKKVEHKLDLVDLLGGKKAEEPTFVSPDGSEHLFTNYKGLTVLLSEHGLTNVAAYDALLDKLEFGLKQTGWANILKNFGGDNCAYLGKLRNQLKKAVAHYGHVEAAVKDILAELNADYKDAQKAEDWDAAKVIKTKLAAASKLAEVAHHNRTRAAAILDSANDHAKDLSCDTGAQEVLDAMKKAGNFPGKAAAKAPAKKHAAAAAAPLAKTGAAVALAAVAASVLAGMGAALRKIRH